MREECIFFCTLRVRYGEVDQQGIVYNGNYGVYADYAFEELIRSRGYTYSDLSGKLESEVCHRKAVFEYFGSVHADDLIEIGVRIVHLGNKSFTLGFEYRREGEEDLLVSAEIVFVGYDAKNRCSRTLTPFLRGLLCSGSQTE